jgi:cytochrome c-type biogenesis protein
MDLNVTYGAAILAGILSFLSPCVLPLVPPYLVYISGVTLDDLKDRDALMPANVRKVLLAALAFVLGFTTVFVFLGATASFIGQALREHLTLLSQIAGVFIVVMGLHFLGLFKIGLLQREARYQTQSKPASLIGAYGVGLAFAFGWTPCIGPVLAAILSLAAREESVSQGMVLLAVYSLGLGIPFLLAGLSVNGFLGFFDRFKSKLHRVEQAMGALLVVTGILFLTGGMQTLSYWLLEQFPALGRLG